MRKIFLAPGQLIYLLLSFFGRLFFFFYLLPPRYRPVPFRPGKEGLLLVVTERPTLT